MSNIRNLVARLRERRLLVGLVVIVLAIIVLSPFFLHDLSRYPARQAIRLRINMDATNSADLLPKDHLTLEKDLIQYETDNRVKIWTAIVQALGGAALLAGLLLTWRTLRATQVKLDIDRASLLTTRFNQATAQLGAQLGDSSPNVEARLGGIYALSWIARDSPKEYWPVVEILTAYVRHNAKWPPAAAPLPAGPGPHPEPKPRTDVQAILKELGQSQPPESEETRFVRKFDLRFTDLRGAEFWDAHLERADFWGAHLEGAKLWSAVLDDAKLENAHLQNANLKCVQFARAILTNADLTGANLEGANLRLAVGVTQAQIDSALNGGRGALPPPGLTVPV